MAISIGSLRKVKADKPPRILIYGPEGIGKTSLANEFPGAAFLQTEEGQPAGTELNSFGLLSTFQEVMDGIQALYEGEHDNRVVVLDSATALQRIVFSETCARGDDKGNAKSSIEDFGYGKGYVYAQRVLGEVLDGLNALRTERGMAVVVIAHSKIERFDDPETVSYDRYEIDIHDKLVGMIAREMDAILLLKKPVTIAKEEQGFNKERSRGDGGTTVFINTAGRPAFVAKNRYGMPEKILYQPGRGFEALAPFLPVIGSPNGSAQPEPDREAA